MRKRAEYINATITIAEVLPRKLLPKCAFRVLCKTPLKAISIEITDRLISAISNTIKIKFVF